MKYYINVTEISKVYTQWEVEADSYEEAVQKLNQTGYDNLDVSAAMTDPNNQTCEYEDYPAETPEDHTPYTLAEFEEA